jgi:hypothetical protein
MEIASMSLCTTCPKKQTCTEICPEVNKILKDAGINSADWIRPERSSAKRNDGKYRSKEVPFSALNTEDKKIFKHKYGDIDDF